MKIYKEALTKANTPARPVIPTIAQKLAGIAAEMTGQLTSWLFAYSGEARREPRHWP